ncbi:TIR domain-containing protein [Rufibacter ruber]|uniref:TIR domain-containing protein n=1 Tax=Rufibacter ruber TaxID=1783499 RepID=UPI00082F9ADA|nr:nucleotide-binding protein [Rufibacter ruber]
MESNIGLINDLINQAEEISYHNGERDRVIKRSEMLFRKIFGNDTHYISALKKIRFSPQIFSTSTPNSTFERAFNNGKRELLNLLSVIAEDLQLESVINQPKATDSSIKNDSKTIFIVHGHNEEIKLAVARTLEKLKLDPIILHEQPSKGRTIIEKFTENSDVSFAIAILSADDIAYARNENPENLRYRARQNVIFELGYFIGKLGRDRVLALHEAVEDFEIPSDYSGVLFVPYDKTGKWQFNLVKELKAVGVSVDANNII